MSSLTSVITAPTAANVFQFIQANKTKIMLSAVALIALIAICYLLTRSAPNPNGFKPDSMKLSP
jgi:hypothetical protein